MEHRLIYKEQKPRISFIQVWSLNEQNISSTVWSTAVTMSKTFWRATLNMPEVIPAAEGECVTKLTLKLTGDINNLLNKKLVESETDLKLT